MTRTVCRGDRYRYVGLGAGSIMSDRPFSVMAGFVPGIHVDARHKAGHDEIPEAEPTLTVPAARLIGEAYRRWGRGMHPAGLNFGDCFAYVVAKAHGCPLLYVGDDFARADIEGVL